MPGSIHKEEYSAKSFVVRGDTRPHKESLKKLGGKWNSRLNDKETGDKFGAWLFWNDKRQEVENWLQKGCPVLQEARDSKYNSDRTVSSSSSSCNDWQLSMQVQLERIEAKLDRILRTHTHILDDDEVIIDSDDDEDEEVQLRMRRLLDQISE